jgi:fucose 4-O-acetylase-like acetyltransferase
MFISLIFTVVLNSVAGVLTLLFANGTTIVETNPYSGVLLQELGPATLIVHALEILVVYSLAEAVSRILSSKRPIFRVKRIYLFTFSLAISVLLTGAAIDLLSDVLVVTFTYDGLVGSLKMVVLSLIIAVIFAARQVNRRWTL